MRGPYASRSSRRSSIFDGLEGPLRKPEFGAGEIEFEPTVRKHEKNRSYFLSAYEEGAEANDQVLRVWFGINTRWIAQRARGFGRPSGSDHAPLWRAHLPNLLAKKLFSIVSWPILACSFSISRADAASASSPTFGSNARAAWSSSCF